MTKRPGGPYAPKGTPDFVGCHKGICFGIEVKLPGKEKTLTKRQAHVLKQMSKADAITALCTTVGQTMRVLDECESTAEAS